ncbi:MAG TPA: RNA ligase family protein [Tepidisphaeraceae bacterium]|jgi:hypothetical protein|nr:RNA ligase family protein [Tepidisphaeraceae bacterium]
MLRKYPRTRHVLGSAKQPGDEDLDSVPFSFLPGRHLVIEEKMDGANCAFSFGPDAVMRLQSRGHFLTGGPRERHFDLFKGWAYANDSAVFDAIGDRYIVYGEWLHAKHTVFYDALPHYFMEFDVLDTQTGEFLNTPRRGELLKGLPLTSVKVLHTGKIDRMEDLANLVGPSHFISPNATQRLRETAIAMRLDAEQVLRQSDTSGLMEGLYIKIEEDGVVKERLKFVRRDFITRIIAADEHWMERPIVPNHLPEGANVF